MLGICDLLGFLCRPSGAVHAVILHFKSHDSSSIFQTSLHCNNIVLSAPFLAPFPLCS